jgi:outer membrane protein assembly complex protein YaeT
MPMIVCRRDRRTRDLVAAACVVALLAWAGRVIANDGPAGRVIADVVPVGNRVRSAEHIVNAMHSRPGKKYDEATVQEDVRRLHATKWFTPGGVRVHTQNDPDGRVTVFVHVAELTNTVQDVQFVGVQHIGRDDLQALTGVRRGDPMNPLANELGRQALLRKYQEDGRYFASVELAEGSKPSDARVVYHVVEGPKVKVAGVRFRGNQFADAGRLKTQLMTKKQFAGFIGGTFRQQTLDADRQRLTEYYHGLGFLGVRVTPEVVRTEDLGEVTVVYHIEEGERYRVAARQIDGNKTLAADKLDPVTELKAGTWYDGRVAKADMERLKDVYGYRGYAVGVEQQLYEVPGSPGVVRVHYQVQGDRGEPDRVGRVIIEGNEVTQDRVILNQLDLRPGQILQYPRLEDARMRLARLGIFDAENPPTVEVLQNELDGTYKDVRVRVQETRTGQFMVGVGVNSDAGLNGSIVLNERNFDLFRFPTSWDDFRYGRAFRGAGQELRLEAVPGTTFQRYAATFREPYLFDSQFGLTNSAYYYNRGFLEYNEDRYGGRFSLDRRLDPFWRATGSLRVEGVGVRDVPWYAPPEIAGDVGTDFLLGLRAGLTRDSRDSFVFPTSGSVFDVGVEQILGSKAYPIATAEATKFFSSNRPGFLQREDGSGKHVVAVRSQLGFASGNTPVYERFYAGGFRSLRGFNFRGVGPRENGLNVGGTFSFLNTVEYQLPLLANDKLFFVTFLDHGTVERDANIKNYRVSAGFGFRMAVPALGPLPIALDFAFPINRAPWDQRQIFSFYVGLFGGQ